MKKPRKKSPKGAKLNTKSTVAKKKSSAKSVTAKKGKGSTKGVATKKAKGVKPVSKKTTKGIKGKQTGGMTPVKKKKVSGRKGPAIETPGGKRPGKVTPGGKQPGIKEPGDIAIQPGGFTPLDLGDLRPGILDTLPGKGTATDDFQKLRTDRPLTLLPVRLETVFTGGMPPRQLKIRLYPDDIHIDDHDPRLTPDEAKAGIEFWRLMSAAKGDADAKSAAKEWLIEMLFERRAAWVAEATKNGATPTVNAKAGSRPAVARCLPKFWRVVGYRRLADGSLSEVFRKDGNPVPLSLCTDPLFGDTDNTGAPPHRNATWMQDFDTAVRFGMGLVVNVSKLTWLKDEGLALVMAYGVGAPASASEADRLEALMTAHRFADGLAFQAQGVPTNASDDARSPVSSHPAAYDGTLETVLTTGGYTAGAAANGIRLAQVIGLGDGSVLTQVEGAERDEDAGQAWMNEALWPVTWGQYFDKLLADRRGRRTVPERVIYYVRDAYLNDVRGGGPLPALRIGAQPYGVLPVRSHHVPQAWVDTEPWYEFLLVKLRDIWLKATPNVAKLSPGGGGTRDEALNEVVRVLGALPHPARFLVRRLEDWRNESHASPLLELLLGMIGLAWVAGGDDPSYGYDSRSIMGQWGWARAVLGLGGGTADGSGLPAHEINRLDAASLSSSQAQIDALLDLRRRLGPLVSKREPRENARAWIDHMIRQVEAHADRLEPFTGALGPLPLSAIDGVLRNQSDDPEIAYHLYKTEPKEFTRQLVSALPAGSEDGQGRVGAFPQVYLGAAAARVPADSPKTRSKPGGIMPREALGVTPGALKRPSAVRMRQADALRKAPAEIAGTRPLPGVVQPMPGGIGRSTVPGRGQSLERSGDKPLLQQLVDAAVGQVRDGQRASFKAALNGLKSLPPATLAWHMRETLGLASNRLDAWLTSLATRRTREMAEKRQVQVGGYGFVLDLKPDGGAPETTGYIHAPSMQQASTAGILRSAWVNHGKGDTMSPLAVNLRSDRLRTADQLIQAVAQGRSLGDLLGQAFERTLHDAGLDIHLYPLREAVLKADGVKHPEVRGPLDGLSLIEADDAGKLKGALNAIKPAPARQQVRDAIAKTRAMFDAAGDAGLAEATHYLVLGNSERAAAILDAVSLGEVPPAELRHARTDISKSELTHTVVVALPDQSEKTTVQKPGRQASHPGLDRYVAPMLPPLGQIRMQVVNGDVIHQIKLSELDLSPIDLVIEGARPGSLGLRAMTVMMLKDERILPNAFAPTSLGADAQAVAPEMEDFEELCGTLAAHLGAMRPAMPEDFGLIDADSDAGLVNDAAMRQKITMLDKRLAGHARALSDAQKKKDTKGALGILLVVVLDGFPSALPGPAILAKPGSVGFWGFVDQAVQAIAARRKKVSPALSKDATRAEMLAALKLLSGNALPPEIAVSGTRLPFGKDLEFNPLPQSKLIDWAGTYAHVRDNVRRWSVAMDTVRLVRGKAAWPLALSQVSTQKHRGWLGLELPPEGTSGGSSWVAVDAGGVGVLSRGEATTAFVIDRWTERLPATKTTTGVAFQFDAPSSKPPQSILLAVTPNGETGWDEALLRRTLIETLENAQLRAVTNDELDRFGHHLPAIFAPGGIDAGPQPSKTDEEDGT